MGPEERVNHASSDDDKGANRAKPEERVNHADVETKAAAALEAALERQRLEVSREVEVRATAALDAARMRQRNGAARNQLADAWGTDVNVEMFTPVRTAFIVACAGALVAQNLTGVPAVPATMATSTSWMGKSYAAPGVATMKATSTSFESALDRDFDSLTIGSLTSADTIPLGTDLD